MKDENYFMKKAIVLAKKAAEADEVPVGAVIVKDGKIIARGVNKKERKNCALFHAEIVAIEKACRKLGNWYLDGCEMYVTLEPCPMCAGALVNSRLDKLVFGAYDPKSGCCGSVMNIADDERFNHRLQVKGGVMQQECASLLSEFFAAKRQKIKAAKAAQGDKKC